MNLPRGKDAVLISLSVVILGVATFIIIRTFAGGPAPETNKRIEVFAKRVKGGHSVTLKDDEELKYLGLRAPYPNEPLHKRSKERNEKLVVGKELFLETEEPAKDSDGRWLAYAFLKDGTFVNAVLVGEGLAYARIQPQVQTYANLLLEAQGKARKRRSGLWAKMTPSDESSYPGDSKHANFHRPTCEEVSKIKEERRIDFQDKDAAFDKGFCPCNKCKP